jgi:hypothetical protein
MNGLHQQLAGKRSDLKANEVKAKSTKADPRDASDAKERLPFLKQEIGRMELEIDQTKAALGLLKKAAEVMDAPKTKGRELALAATYLETAIWRLTNHLGTAPEPSKPAKAGAS